MESMLSIESWNEPTVVALSKEYKRGRVAGGIALKQRWEGGTKPGVDEVGGQWWCGLFSFLLAALVVAVLGSLMTLSSWVSTWTRY